MPLEVDWTPELEASILGGIENGLTLRQVADLHSISDSLILKKVRENKDFREQYARAMEVRADRDFEGLEDDLSESPAMISTKFGEMIDPSWVALKRLKVDTKKWALSKRIPKKYGDKLQAELTGEFGIRTVVVSPNNRQSQKPGSSPEFDDAPRD